ncbi:MAG: BMP family ABC transporter substrate-binding protein [Chloroflexota bacterium]|nr:BMP family ABC transporter substrate-binding protein [Chloroflexota bacterium]
MTLVVLALALAACGGGGASGSPAGAPETGGGSPAESGGAGGGFFEENCGAEDAGDRIRIGGVTDVGQLEDKSFNQAGWCGTLAGANAVGGSARVIVTEDPADYQTNMQTLVDENFEIIVTYGFALGNDTAIMAKKTPDVHFIGIDQFICVDQDGDPDPTNECAGDAAELLPNYEGLNFNEAQPGYLAGVVAGNITETNVIGTLGGIDTIPPVVDYIGGYVNGAHAVDEDIEVLVQYVSDDITVAFNDPGTGRSIADQMIGQDADVLFQVAGLSGQGMLEAACDEGIYAIGVDVDQALYLPNLADCIVTSAEKKIVDAVSNAIKNYDAGSPAAGNVFLDAGSNPVGIGLAPYHDFEDLITPEIQQAVDDARTALAAGDLDPCAGEGFCFFGDPDE